MRATTGRGPGVRPARGYSREQPGRSKRAPFLEYDPIDFDVVINGTLTAGFHMGQLVARQMVADPVEPRDGLPGQNRLYIQRTCRDAVWPERGVQRGQGRLKSHGADDVGRTQSASHQRQYHRARWIDTPGERESFGLDKMRETAPKLPWGRLGTPQDIGRAATFLSSEDADYVTGTTLRVDGGFVLKECRATRCD